MAGGVLMTLLGLARGVGGLVLLTRGSAKPRIGRLSESADLGKLSREEPVYHGNTLEEGAPQAGDGLLERVGSAYQQVEAMLPAA